MQMRFSPTGLGLILTFVVIIGSVLSLAVLKGHSANAEIMTDSPTESGSQ
jgi:hypothetical protein